MTISFQFVVDFCQVIDNDGNALEVNRGSETHYSEKNAEAQATYYSLQPITKVTLTKYVRTWFPEFEGYEWVPEWTKNFTWME